MELGIFERQLRLMVLLTQNREYSLDELCRKLDMSRRTLYRYLELFRDIGFEVVKQGNVYRLDKSSPFFKEITQLVHFTEDEALTLRHVLDMASGTDVQVRHLRHKLERIYDFGILNAVEADPGQAEKLQQLYEAVRWWCTITVPPTATGRATVWWNPICFWTITTEFAVTNCKAARTRRSR